MKYHIQGLISVLFVHFFGFRRLATVKINSQVSGNDALVSFLTLYGHEKESFR